MKLRCCGRKDISAYGHWATCYGCYVPFPESFRWNIWNAKVLVYAQVIQEHNKWVDPARTWREANDTWQEIIQFSQCWKCSLPTTMAWSEIGNHREPHRLKRGWNQIRAASPSVHTKAVEMRWESKPSKPDFSVIWYMTYHDMHLSELETCQLRDHSAHFFFTNRTAISCELIQNGRV